MKLHTHVRKTFTTTSHAPYANAKRGGIIANAVRLCQLVAFTNFGEKFMAAYKPIDVGIAAKPPEMKPAFMDSQTVTSACS
jgi:hypothetical protein